MRFFNVDNPVWRFIRKIGYLWILNILWVVTSLPIITIGASTTALIFACMKLRDDEGYPTINYFKSFKENFRQATIIWLIYIVIGAVLIYGLIFWNLMDGTKLRIGHAFAIAVLIPYVLSLLYVFGIQAKFVNSVQDTIHYALILPIKHFGWTLQMVILMAVVIYLNVATIVWANFLTLTVGIGWIAYLYSIYYMQVFDRYIPKVKEETEGIEESDEIEGSDGIEGFDEIEGSDGIKSSKEIEGSDGIEGFDEIEGSDGIKSSKEIEGSDEVEGSDRIIVGRSDETEEDPKD